MSNILEEILFNKREEIKNRKAKISESNLLDKIRQLEVSNEPFRFYNKLDIDIKNKDLAIITEIKKASPSTGIIRENFNHTEIAKDYERAGASTISILTDEKYFLGNDTYLTEVKKNVTIPLLRKDFTIDPYQVIEAKSIGADAILLIMSALSINQAMELEQVAIECNLSTIVETHNEKEIEKALRLKSKLIGVNNRNLTNMKISLDNMVNLSKYIPDSQGYIKICESGIKTKDDINKIKDIGVKCFLVGSSLMKQENIYEATKNLIN